MANDLEAVVNDMEYFLSEEGMAEWITDLINGVHTVEDLREEFYEWLKAKGKE